jgi:hypothetical protein
MHRQPLLDVGDVEAQERPDLVEGNAPLVHQQADEPLGDAKPGTVSCTVLYRQLCG